MIYGNIKKKYVSTTVLVLYTRQSLQLYPVFTLFMESTLIFFFIFFCFSSAFLSTFLLVSFDHKTQLHHSHHKNLAAAAELKSGGAGAAAKFKLKKITHRLAHRLAVRQFVSESTRVQYLQQELEGGRKATCCQRVSRRRRMLHAWRATRCWSVHVNDPESLWLVKTVAFEAFEIGVQTYGAFTASNYMYRNRFRIIVLLCNVVFSPIALALSKYELAMSLDIMFDVAYTFIGLSTFLQYFYEMDAGTEVIVARKRWLVYFVRYYFLSF